jgi:hypothetical protein
MSAEKIFDAVNKLSWLSSISDQRRRKLEQIRSVEARRCGNCFHWMKSSCMPEKKLGQFKHTNSFACAAFDIKPLKNELAAEFKRELADIEADLEAIR